MSIQRGLFLFFTLTLPLFAGCLTVHEVVTSEPYNAEIYWGESEETLEKSGVMTPYSTIHRGMALESRCFQVKKDGYHESEINCRPDEDYRHVHFDLRPLTTMITSDPPGATILWGPTREDLEQTEYETPFAVKADKARAGWKDWYFKVQKDGYPEPEIVFLAQEPTDRQVHFDLKGLVRSEPKADPETEPDTKPQIADSEIKVTLSWEDHSSDELGFKVERKDGPGGRYREIGTVGPNITSYTDKGLIPGKKYFYRIRAFNETEYSGYTDEIPYEVPRR
jgi:hypothetical protein